MLIEAYLLGRPQTPGLVRKWATGIKQAEFYRKRARDMRELARRAGDAQLRAKLVEVALEYDRLAEEAGAQS